MSDCSPAVCPPSSSPARPATTSSCTNFNRDTLHWLSYPQRVTYKLCLLTCKCLHRLAPPEYLSRSCIPLESVAGRSRLRSAGDNELYVPRTRTETFWSEGFLILGSNILELTDVCTSRSSSDHHWHVPAEAEKWTFCSLIWSSPRAPLWHTIPPVAKNTNRRLEWL